MCLCTRVPACVWMCLLKTVTQVCVCVCVLGTYSNWSEVLLNSRVISRGQLTAEVKGQLQPQWWPISFVVTALQVRSTESESISPRKNNKQSKKEKKKMSAIPTMHVHSTHTSHNNYWWFTAVTNTQMRPHTHMSFDCFSPSEWGLAQICGMRKITFVILSFLCLFSLSVLYFCRVHRAAHLQWRIVL